VRLLVGETLRLRMKSTSEVRVEFPRLEANGGYTAHHSGKLVVGCRGNLQGFL